MKKRISAKVLSAMLTCSMVITAPGITLLADEVDEAEAGSEITLDEESEDVTDGDLVLEEPEIDSESEEISDIDSEAEETADIEADVAPDIIEEEDDADIIDEPEIADINISMAGLAGLQQPQNEPLISDSAPENPENPETATENITLSNVKIWSFEKTIIVENAEKEIVIADMSGRVVKNIKPENTRTEIHLNKGGIFLVKTGLSTKKVVIR